MTWAGDPDSVPERAVTNLLREEIACLDSILSALEYEQSALARRDPTALAATAAEKDRLVGELKRKASDREALLRQAFPDPDRPWGANPSMATARSLWQRHESLLAEAKQRNRVNAAIIRAAQSSTERAIEVLLGVDPTESTYGARGGVEPAARSRYASSA